MNRYLLILSALSSMFWFYSFLAVTIYFTGCKSPTSAPVEPVTEQPREPRPAPVAPHSAYIPYTNSQQDALVEYSGIVRPPALPGKGPIPVYKSPPAVSNWMTKAMAVQPKPMGTNQIPGSTILTKITTTDSDGKQFTAELTLEGNSRVQATDKMAVVIFSINTENWIVESCTNLLDGKWYPMASGTGENTNSGALVIVDLKEDSSPVKFYRQKPAP